MCLAIPGRILRIDGEDPLTRVGRVDFGGVIKEIHLAFVPEAAPGEYVLVHVGVAIQRIDESEALRVFEMLGQLGEWDGDAGVEGGGAVPEDRPQVSPVG